MSTQTNTENQRIHQILLKMKELFQENDWIRYSWAVNAQGMPVTPRNKDACGFCLLGALLRASANNYSIETAYPNGNSFENKDHARNYYSTIYVLGDVLLEQYREINISIWNDYKVKNKEEVIALIDKAIEKVTQ